MDDLMITGLDMANIFVNSVSNYLLDAAVALSVNRITPEEFAELRDRCVKTYGCATREFDKEDVEANINAMNADFDRILPASWRQGPDRARMN